LPSKRLYEPTSGRRLAGLGIAFQCLAPNVHESPVRGPVDRISGDQALSARRTELAAVRRADRTFTDDSTLGYLQTDANFTGFVIGEANSGLFKYFLYFEDRGEVSFHYPFILLDALKRRQADPGAAGKLTLAPAQERPRCPYLRRISH
jgi:hypothetical protein